MFAFRTPLSHIILQIEIVESHLYIVSAENGIVTQRTERHSIYSGVHENPNLKHTNSWRVLFAMCPLCSHKIVHAKGAASCRRVPAAAFKLSSDRHSSKPSRSNSMSISLPINTNLFVRSSPSSHSRSGDPSNMLWTPCKRTSGVHSGSTHGTSGPNFPESRQHGSMCMVRLEPETRSALCCVEC